MTRDDVINEYFDWMYDLVCGCKRVSFRKLLSYLNDVDFIYIIPMDGNRAEDGINLRYRFGQECEYDDFIIAAYLDDKPCSVLEMMIALAIRLEEQFMYDPEIGDRTSQWFWEMIENLGLYEMNDSRFDLDTVERIVDIFLNREYGRNGEGGLFKIEHSANDLRNVEIWYQLCEYLDSVLDI